MKQEFQGTSLALTAAALQAAADRLHVGIPEVWTVLTVETQGCGFLADRRPPILFERHIFSKLTNRQFDCCDVSDPSAGGYGPSGPHQYERLASAIALNRSSALESASWGMAQIMGENYRAAGFSDVETMVAGMCDSEDAQVAAFAAFLAANRLDRHLQSHDWTALAKGYNGPSYVENHYDEKLAAAFTRFSAGLLPDLAVRTAQLYLTFAGFEPGAVDGIMGARTRVALISYQTAHGLPATGAPDPATLQRLAAFS